jgi:hypothetical protein
MTDFSGWMISNQNGTRHVVPINDLKPHKVESCWCNPTDDEGLIIHNSMDLREKFETGDRVPS